MASDDDTKNHKNEYSMVPFKDDGFFWITFYGDFSIGSLGRAYEAFRSHPDYVPGTDELADFSQGSIENLSRDDVERIRQYMAGTSEQHHCKSVLVVGTTVEYGVGRMLTLTLERDAPVNRFVARTIREGVEWMRPGRADELMEAHSKALLELEANSDE